MSAIFLLSSFSLYRPFSSSLVITTLNPVSINFFCSFFAIERLTSFSRIPLSLFFPGSIPPCPLSITTVFFVKSIFIPVSSASALLYTSLRIRIPCPGFFTNLGNAIHAAVYTAASVITLIAVTNFL